MHAYAARDPLLDLHEISRGIVLWYQGEGRSGGIGNGFDHPFVDYTPFGFRQGKYLLQ